MMNNSEQTQAQQSLTHRKTRYNGESKKQEDKASSTKANKKQIISPDAEAILEDTYKVIAEPQICCTLEGTKFNDSSIFSFNFYLLCRT